MLRRIIALLLAVMLLAGGASAFAEAGDIVIGADIAQAGELPPEGEGLSLDGMEGLLLANGSAEANDQPVELTVTKSGTKKVTLGLRYQIVVPGKTIKACKSSDRKIATVSNTGLIKLKKAGTAKITITPKKGGTLKIKLKVIDPSVPTDVIINEGAEATIAAGETLQLTASVLPDTAPQDVTWKSSDTGVATVGADGLVTTLKKGAVTITAATGNKLTAKLALTVLKAPPKPYVIAHAMGGIDGSTYTNSLEAFQQNYAKGHRLFEIDLHFTSDGKLVLWHSWDYKFCSKHTPGYKPSYKEFMGSKIYDRYTPLDLKKLLKLMSKYPDVRIVLDGKYGKIDTAKREYKQILSTAKDLKLTKVLKRVTVELYNEEMLGMIKKIYNFPEYMLALYKIFESQPTEEAFRPVAEYCGRKGIPTIVMDVNWWNPNFVDIAAEYGVKLALYTVNDPAEAQEFFDAGVIALFTDALPPM